MMSTTVPFSGFYETVHSNELERLAEDEDGNWSEELSDKVDWKEEEKNYAISYMMAVAEIADIDLEFDELTSPREYNFQTDRIFAEISEADVKKMLDAVDKKKLDELIHRRFTSRDGFSSFYDNWLGSWEEQKEPWDHNQVGTLLECYLDQINPDWRMEAFEKVNG